MPKGIPNKRYTPEFKQLVGETMLNEKLSYSETERQFEVVRSRITAWERVYLSEGPEGFLSSDEDVVAKVVQRNCRIQWKRFACRGTASKSRGRLLKKSASLGFGRRATPAQRTQVVQKLRQIHSLWNCCSQSLNYPEQHLLSLETTEQP